jgi:hypothetical protein
MIESTSARQKRFRENMKNLGYRRVERWEKSDGTDAREFDDRGKLLLNSLLQTLLTAVEKGVLTYTEYEAARDLWRPLLGGAGD